MAWPEFSPTAALRALVTGGVDFVVVGGIATVVHGGATVTKGLDIVPAPDQVNLDVLGSVLQGIRARLRGIDDGVPSVPDGRSLRKSQVLCLETAAGQLDVLMAPKAAPSYPALRASAVRVLIAELPVLIASLDDLIAMKLAAGRPKDLLAVDELRAIRRLTR